AALAGDVLDAGQHVRPVGVRVAVEGELVPAGELPAVAGPADDEGGRRLLLHTDARGPLVVHVEPLQVRRPVAAALVHAVEALGVVAGVAEALQLAPRPAQAGAHGPGPHAARADGRPVEVPVRQLEAVVPEEIPPGPQLLRLPPGVAAALGTVPAAHL